MAEPSHYETGFTLNRYMRIALDEYAERDVRLAAEALASAILNGTPDQNVRGEALEILLKENELRAIEALGRFFPEASRRN